EKDHGRHHSGSLAVGKYATKICRCPDTLAGSLPKHRPCSWQHTVVLEAALVFLVTAGGAWWAGACAIGNGLTGVAGYPWILAFASSLQDIYEIGARHAARGLCGIARDVLIVR